MWDDDISWQYHQDERDAAANDGALALLFVTLALAVALAVEIFI